jgi:hypothetical protein
MRALAEKNNRRQELTPSDLEAAERLYKAHPSPDYRSFAKALLLTAAAQQAERHNYPEAIGYLERVLLIEPDASDARLHLLRLEEASMDWGTMERVARDGLAHDPRNPQLLNALARALYRQDRNREAAETLRTSLQLQEDSATRAFYNRIVGEGSSERGMLEQKVAHFDVRYDGDVHDEIGREVTTALEHHYATLARAMDYELHTTVPVVVLTKEKYYDGGVPTWSGGGFFHESGRIRIPVLGLSSSLTPFMDYALLHELTHAFVNERTRGLCPLDLNEGIAQYMGNIRMPSSLSTRDAGAMVGALQQGGHPNYFYAGALSLVEYLIGNRGVGGFNDLLKAMGDTGDVDGAFRQVYGQSANEMRQAWAQRLLQQSGG